MKTILLVFSILLAFPVFGQNYRTISTGSEVYFDFKDANSSISRVILTDSFQILNNDTIIYHKFNQEFEIGYDTIYNPMFQTYDIACFSTNDTGFLSYKTILQDDGTDIFFNRFHDSIFIQTQANLNDSWIFYQNSNGSYFEASVSSIVNDNFLGLTDSIKTITLQAKDSSGNNIASPYDTLNIRISKNYGLIEAFNIFRFPYGTTAGEYIWSETFKPINILGLPQYNVGIKNLTIRDVFDYEIGDEYHWKEKSGPPQGNGQFAEVYDIITINNKSFSSNGDTVYYDIYLKQYVFGRSVDFSLPDYIYSFDTLYIGNKTIAYYIANSKIDTYPLHYDTDSVITWIQSEDGNRKTIVYGDNPTWNVGGCNITEIRFAGTATYHKGLGITYEEGGVNFPSLQRKFVYYNKNGTPWGTPLNIDSLSIVSTKSIVQNDLNLKVFPNPTSDLLNFQFDEPIDNSEIRIYSTIGQLMETQNVINSNIQFNVSDWNEGVYFYGVYVEGKLVKQGQVLVEN